VVVASLLGREVKAVSLRPPSCWARGDGFAAACIALAGPLAEMRRFKQNTAQLWANGWSGDAANARERFGDHLGGAIRRTDHLLSRHWAAVERVADALLERGSLSGAELERLSGGTAEAARRPAAGKRSKPGGSTLPATWAPSRSLRREQIA
jgi:hypothetical protein